MKGLSRVAALLLASSAGAMVLCPPLDGHVDGSALIVLGKVGWVETLEADAGIFGSVRLALLEPERVLKGKPDGPIHVLATPTWTCDVSGAMVGERAVFFLNPIPRSRRHDGDLRMGGTFWANVDRVLGPGAVIHEISGKLSLDEAGTHVRAWDMQLAREFRLVRRDPSPERLAGYRKLLGEEVAELDLRDTWVALDEVVQYISSRVRTFTAPAASRP